MRILITGCKGQLGRALVTTLSEHTLLGVDLPELDITDYHATRTAIQAFQPQVVINAAAYTDTAGCERDPDLAFRVNALAVQILANLCREVDAALVQISTNEVFDGSQTQPYMEWDAPHPLNAYARSKLAGERYAQAWQRSYIVRTAWLYGEGTSNFIYKMTRLADERGELSVVTDEIATPTYAKDLATAIAQLINTPLYGIYHFTNSGACSRFEWMQRILELSGRHHVRLSPTTMRSFPGTPVKPPYSVLRNFVGATLLGITLRPWQDALEDFMAQVAR